MTATLALPALLALATSAGFHLRLAEPDEQAPLYVWCTVRSDDSPGDVVYIGKARSKSRLGNEAGWATLDPHGDEILSGFVNLIRRNRAKGFPVAVEPFNGREDGFDPRPATAAMATWWGAYPQRLRERIASGQPWSIPDIETFLIRLTVRCGVPTGNASCAGLWESWIGEPRDTLAVIATDAIKATELPIHGLVTA